MNEGAKGIGVVSGGWRWGAVGLFYKVEFTEFSQLA